MTSRRHANWRHGHARRGMPRSRAYRIWSGVIRRCADTKCRIYKYYGGRGIRVCARWRKFENFLADMGEPTADATIDRKNSNGNYTPANCRWATMKEQQNNRRDNRRIRFGGKVMTLTQWAETATGLSVQTLWRRLNEGWPMRRALSEPPQTHKRNHRYARKAA